MPPDTTFRASFEHRPRSPKHIPAEKAQKSPETRGFGDFSWQGQKESNPRHAVLEGMWENGRAAERSGRFRRLRNQDSPLCGGMMLF